MATKLDKLLKREIDIDGKPYMVTLSPEGVKLTEKGKRKGQEVSWKGLVNGEAATAVSLAAGGAPVSTPTGTGDDPSTLLSLEPSTTAGGRPPVPASTEAPGGGSPRTP